jgi:hypothetical protein
MENENNVSVQKLPTASEFLRDTWNDYKAKWYLYVGIMAIPVALFVGSLIIPNDILGGFLAIAYYIVMILAFIALGLAVKDDGNQKLSVYYSQSPKYFWGAVWIWILMSLVEMGSFILFILPVFYFGIALIFAYFVMIVEDKRGFSALETSYRYVRGRWWDIFIPYLLVSFFIGIMSTLIVFTIILISTMLMPEYAGFVSTLVTAFLQPLTVIFLYRMYLAVKALPPVAHEGAETNYLGRLKGLAILGIVVSLGAIVWLIGSFV